MDDRKFFFVTGKGGVGKTTVVAALAKRFEQQGRRILVAMAEPNERLSLLLGSGPLDHRIRQVSSGIWAVNIDSPEAIQEYGELTLGSKRAAAAIFANRHVRAFLGAVPGLFQWAILGKTLYHSAELTASGEPRFDVVLLDAPATGHAVEMLRVPRVIMDAVPAGALRRDAEDGWRKLQDRSHTAVVLVTLPESTPVDETLELSARLDEIGVPASWLVVNQVLPGLFAPANAAALAALPVDTTPDAPAVDRALARARERACREVLQADNLERLERALPLEISRVPYVLGGVESGSLAQVATALGR